jgi:hypothetical protein
VAGRPMLEQIVTYYAEPPSVGRLNVRAVPRVCSHHAATVTITFARRAGWLASTSRV